MEKLASLPVVLGPPAGSRRSTGIAVVMRPRTESGIAGVREGGEARKEDAWGQLGGLSFILS